MSISEDDLFLTDNPVIDSTKIYFTSPVQEIRGADVWLLLTSAFEGGSNYWIDHVSITERPPVEFKFYQDIPLLGGTLSIYPVEENDPVALDIDAIMNGLENMQKKYPHHWANWKTSNDDADTGDCFLQCCLFGECIYA